MAQVALADGQVDYLHSDLIGSVRTTTDGAGGVTSDADYDTYGKPIEVSTDPVSAVTRFGYAGEYTDTSGYLYLRARYYDPVSAQFISVDPLVDQTRSPYGYTDGNPLQFADPLGLDWLQDMGDWSAAFGDTLTFGGTKWVREQLGVDGAVNYCSDFYTWGGHGGTIASFAPGGAGAIKLGGWAASASAKLSGVASAIAGKASGAVRAVSARLSAARSCAVNSFTGDTLVLLADGRQVPISSIRAGQEVIATDPETGETAARPVLEVIVHGGEHTMVDLTFDDGSTISATDEHPFWVVGDQEFAYAIDLQIGQVVLTADGGLLAITGTRTYSANLDAFNLAIADIHTFYAGDTPVLVHNTCADAYTVYQSVKNGNVTYVGITRAFSARHAWHKLQGRDVTPLYSGLTKDQARGVEQVLIDHWGRAKDHLGNAVTGTSGRSQLDNIINSTSPTRSATFRDRAWKAGKSSTIITTSTSSRGPRGTTNNGAETWGYLQDLLVGRQFVLLTMRHFG